MAHDYSEEDDYDGDSDHQEAQVYIGDEISEDHSHLYDDEASEEASDSEDESKDHTGFVDDEASEAESDLKSDTLYESSNAVFPNTLHKFMHLPIELREMIWKTFCTDLSNNPRVYEINFCGRYPKFAAQVEGQTAPLRIVLAVHQESRALGHKFAPDLIQLPKDHGVAPCHMERDIVLVDWRFDHRYCPGLEELEMLSEAAPGLQNLAVRSGVTLFDGGPDLDRLYSLRNVFVSQEAELISTRGLTWCVSDKTHSYHVVHQEDVGSGLTEDVDMIFYWPDPEKYGESGERSFSSRTFASLQFDEEGVPLSAEGERLDDAPGALNTSNWGYEIARLREWLDPLHEMSQSSAEQSRSGSSEPETGEWEDKDNNNNNNNNNNNKRVQEKHERKDQNTPPQPQRICVWPLTRFMFANGLERLEAMKAWQKPWDEWESDWEASDLVEDWSGLDSDDSLNDFVDFTIDSESDDDNDDDEEEEEAPPQSEDDEGAPSHTTPHHDHGLEPADESESSTEIGEPSRARQKSRVVIALADSSEEGEEEGEEAITAPQRARGSNRRARARPIPIDSEDDDEDAPPQPPRRGGARRAAVSLSDSEDDSKSAGAESTAQDEKDISSKGEQDSSDEEETPPPPPPRMSLAKRLRLEAAEARAALAAEDSDVEDQDRDTGASDGEEDVSGEDEMSMAIAEDDDEEDEEAW